MTPRHPPPGPPSPTELSYTQLARRAPPLGGARCRDDRGVPQGHGHGHGHGLPAGVSATPAPVPAPRLPRTAPPASIVVPQTAGDCTYFRTPSIAPMAVSASVPMPGGPQTTAGPLHRGPAEDRVSRLSHNLATRMRALQPTSPDDPFDSSSSHGQWQGRPSDRLAEMKQFIETLKGMQTAVSRTADQQQRVKKSRALNALLSMFESIIEEQPQGRRLDERARRLEAENARLRARDGQLQNELARARDECRAERQRAREAEAAAAESGAARDGLLANYARLTEEQVALRDECQDAGRERGRAATEAAACRREAEHLRTQCERWTARLRQEEADGARARDEAGRLATELQAANDDRQRAWHAARPASSILSLALPASNPPAIFSPFAVQASRTSCIAPPGAPQAPPNSCCNSGSSSRGRAGRLTGNRWRILSAALQRRPPDQRGMQWRRQWLEEPR